MRRKSSLLAILALLAEVMMLGACSVNEDIQESDNNVVCFTAGIGDLATPQGTPVTRAAGTTWDSGDAIGIFMVGNGGTTTVHADNKQYTTTDGSTFISATGNEIFYPMDGSKVDFIAYYPYESSVTAIDNTIAVDVSGTQTNDSQAAIDLLWAKADNSGAGYDKETHKSASVALTFEHKLAKLMMNCKAEDNVGISDFDGVTVSIGGMNTQGTLILSDGTLGTPNTQAAITPVKVTASTGFSASYDAIILPSSYATEGVVTVDFTVNGETFTWNVPAIIFNSGYEYIYEVTLTRTGVRVVTGTIKPWDTIVRQGVTAE